MKYSNEIKQAATDPAALESLYRQALQTNKSAEFTLDMTDCQASDPDNLLFKAWLYRLQGSMRRARMINWTAAILLALVNGLYFGVVAWTSTQGSMDFPMALFSGSAITGITVIAFLYFSQAGPKKTRLALILGAILAAAAAYNALAVPSMTQFKEYAGVQMALHLGLLSWAMIGLFLTAGQAQNGPQAHEQRFAFLVKSLEVFTVSGLALIAGAIFYGVTIILFEALNIKIPDEVVSSLVLGSVGLVPVLAVAWVYDPQVSPAEQDFQQGVMRILSVLLRILVVPTLLVGLLYVILIPFNFMAPFLYREVLIAYNVMLFAVLALLLGATPLQLNELSPRSQSLLRIALTTIAVLTAIVSVYALAAILYRTAVNGLTLNRFIVIGWNLINTAIIGLMIYFQLRPAGENWVTPVKRVYGIAALCYIGWTALVLLLVPLIFH